MSFVWCPDGWCTGTFWTTWRNTRVSIAWNWCVSLVVRWSESVLIESKLVGVTRGLSYLHDNDVVHGDLKGVIGVSFSFIESFRLTYHLSQPNVLIDGKGSPRLSDFGLCSITTNIDSINASTPHQGCTIRYCAPELLDVGITVKDAKRKPTNKSDVYSLSMVIVEVCIFCRGTTYSGSGYLPFQLATGKMPFPGYSDHNIPIMILKGRRPPKPAHFEAPGITPAVWKIAEKCWHQKAKERPEAKVVLECLENLANPSECTHETYSCSPRS